MFGKLKNIISNAVDSVGPNIGIHTGGTHNDHPVQSASAPSSSASTPTGSGYNFSTNPNFFLSAAAARSTLSFGRSASSSSLSSDSRQPNHQEQGPPPKFRYTRPNFLQLNTDDEIQVSADHQIRPIIVPRDISRMPWNSGYAETINAGKSQRNEDQACIYRGTLRTIVAPETIYRKVCDMMPSVPGYPQQFPLSNPRAQLSNDGHINNHGTTVDSTAANHGASSNATSMSKLTKKEITTGKEGSSLVSNRQLSRDDPQNSRLEINQHSSIDSQAEIEKSGAKIANASSNIVKSEDVNLLSKSDKGGDSMTQKTQKSNDSLDSLNNSQADLAVKPDSLPIPQTTSQATSLSTVEPKDNLTLLAKDADGPKSSDQHNQQHDSKSEGILSPLDLVSPSQPIPLSKIAAETSVGEDPLNALGTLPVVTNHFNGESNDHVLEMTNECFSTPPTSPKKVKPLV